MPRSLYLLDGHYLIYRAYYAPFPPLTAPSGEPTKATHVFCSMLFNLIRDRQPDYLAMTMDTSDEPLFRCDIDPEYKANRQPPPEDFGPQRDRIISIVQAMDIPIFRVPSFEADDLMATIVEKLTGHDIEVFLVSVDKDLEQLISDNTRLYDAAKDVVVDAASLEHKKGYTPRQAVDIQTLTGDSVDNIPGIVGVGLKTAARLIKQYGSAQALLDHADRLTPKLRERVKAFADQMSRTRELVTLRRDAPVDFDLQDCVFAGPAVDKVRPIFKELALTRLTEQLPLLSPSAESAAAEESPVEPVRRTDGGDYRLIDDVEKLESLAAELSKQQQFAFDTETTGLNPISAHLVGISLSWKSGTGCYLPIRAATGNTLPVRSVVEKLKPIFANRAIRKYGHNLKFDILVLRQVGIDVRGACFDTMLADFLLEPLRPSHGLKALSREVLGFDMTPISDLIGKGKNQISIDQVDATRVCHYAAADADCTWRLAQHFKPRIEAGDFQTLFEDLEMPLVEVLSEMEHNGVAIDTDILARMSNSMASRLQTLTRQIHAQAGHPFNIESTKQLAQVLFDEQGLDVIRRTKTGRSTDAETLTALAATTTNEIPRLVLEYRELAKLKNTYVDTLPEMINPSTGRIHASFHQTGAVTGRLSSSNPNLQNIPVRTQMGREIRRAFVAGRKGHVLLTADYSQIELRILAHFSGDNTLRGAFTEGRDIHAFVAAQVNNVPIEQVSKDQRRAAKAVNFGIIYGQSSFGLSRSLGISVSQAKAFIDTYFSRYPGIRSFIKGCIARAKERGYVETILGRRRPVDELRSRNRQRAAWGQRIAVNTVIQGSAADLIKRAMIDIHRTIQSADHPARMLIQVHDELVFEVPQEHVEGEAEMIRDKMCTAIPLDVPILVDINWGPNWLEGK